MPIYRTIKDSNYSVISNYTYLKDNDLSFGAIGLMTLLLSCKDDTNFSLKFIGIISCKSIKIVTKYLNELKINNYVYIKKSNTKDGYTYMYYIYEDKKFNPFFISENPDTQNPTWENPPMEIVVANKYYNKKDKIDKNKLSLNLCFLTNYLIDWDFIKLNDINLFSYDSFLTEFIKDEEIRQVISVVNYVVRKIKDNNYKDENDNPIINLLSYFKESCRHNLDCMKARSDPHLFDDWL